MPTEWPKRWRRWIEVETRPDLREPGRLRSAVRPSQRRGRLRPARSKNSTPGFLSLERKLQFDDLVIITADHGCDPTTPSTDHSREYVPLAGLPPRKMEGINLGLRRSLSDIGQTVAENFGTKISQGASFLAAIA